MILIVDEEELKKFDGAVWFQKGYERAHIFAVVNRETGLKVVKNKFGMRGRFTLPDFYRAVGVTIKHMKEKK